MRLQGLPPVWRPVPKALTSAREGRQALSRHFGGEHVLLLASGTQALTVAIREAIGARDPSSCNVVLPAYACPDIVTACVGAGAEPRLIDVASSFVGYDLDQLKSSIDAHTAAIVAVNLLGSGDCAAELSGISRVAGVPLIQDWAQSLPRTPLNIAGTHLVLSFGRGKPLNLLGGGALIGSINTNYPACVGARIALRNTTLAAAAFRVLTHPAMYGAVETIARSSVGSTLYKMPESPCVIPDGAPSRISEGLRTYIRAPSYRVIPYLGHFGSWLDLGIRPLSESFLRPDCEPVRLPLLARNREHRDRIVSLLKARGLGATTLYGTTLERVPGIPHSVRRQGPFPKARDLADRLLTLPTHARIDETTSAAVHECLLIASQP